MSINENKIDWLTIQNEYISGVDYSELSAKYGVKESTLRKRSERGRWSQARHETAQTVTELAIKTVIENKVEQLIKLNERDLKSAEALRAKAEAMIREVSTPNELKALSGAFEIVQKISRLALGASTENNTVTTKELPVSVDEFV